MTLLEALKKGDLFYIGDFSYQLGGIPLEDLSEEVQKDCAFATTEDQFLFVYLDLTQEVTVNQTHLCVSAKVGYCEHDPEPEECNIFIYRTLNVFCDPFD